MPDPTKNSQLVFERLPALQGLPNQRINVIVNNDNTFSIYIEDRANSDFQSNADSITATGLPLKGAASSTPPGGLSGQVQYNNAGAFGGITKQTSDGINTTFAAGGLIASDLKPPANSVTAFQIQNAAGTSAVLNIDTTNGRVGIGSLAPSVILEIAQDGRCFVQITSNVTGTTSGGVVMRHARGTQAAPLPLNAGDIVGSLIANGYNLDGGYESVAEIRMSQLDQTSGSTLGDIQLRLGSGPTLAFDFRQIMVGANFRNVSGFGTAASFISSATIDARDITAAQTLEGKVINASGGGTFDTTAGALNNYAASLNAAATRSAGANNLTNIGLYVTAAGGQVNHCAEFDQGEIIFKSTTAMPVHGSTAARVIFGTTAGFGIYYGSDTPTVSAAKGSLYLRSDGTGVNDRAYINTDGGTTWTPIVTVG